MAWKKTVNWWFLGNASRNSMSHKAGIPLTVLSKLAVLRLKSYWHLLRYRCFCCLASLQSFSTQHILVLVAIPWSLTVIYIPKPFEKVSSDLYFSWTSEAYIQLLPGYLFRISIDLPLYHAKSSLKQCFSHYASALFLKSFLGQCYLIHWNQETNPWGFPDVLKKEYVGVHSFHHIFWTAWEVTCQKGMWSLQFYLQCHPFYVIRA